MKEKEVFILPGWVHGKESWLAYLEKMPEAVVLELPGFGAEPRPEETWGVPEYAEWVAKKLKEKAPQSIVLVGHSFGGRVGAYLGSQKPSWLAGLVLYGAPLLYRPRLETRGKIALAKALKPLVPKKMRKVFLSEDAKQAERLGMQEIFKRVISFDQCAFLPEISVPTLVLHGEKDKEAPYALAKEAVTLIPNVRFESIQGGGHNLHLERPELFYGIVSRFIKSI